MMKNLGTRDKRHAVITRTNDTFSRVMQNIKKRFLIILSAYVPTSEASLTVEEEDAIVTLVVVVIGIIIAMVVLFSMGIFIDCKHQYVTMSLF